MQTIHRHPKKVDDAYIDFSEPQILTQDEFLSVLKLRTAKKEEVLKAKAARKEAIQERKSKKLKKNDTTSKQRKKRETKAEIEARIREELVKEIQQQQQVNKDAITGPRIGTLSPTRNQGTSQVRAQKRPIFAFQESNGVDESPNEINPRCPIHGHEHSELECFDSQDSWVDVNRLDLWAAGDPCGAQYTTPWNMGGLHNNNQENDSEDTISG